MILASSFDSHDLPEDIERCRELFEKHWGTAEAPDMERLLDEVPPERRAALLYELLLVEFEFLLRRRIEPKIDTYMSKFSGYETVVHKAVGTVADYSAFKRKRIEGYTLGEEIGHGAMGIVYQAVHDRLKKKLAVKIVRKSLLQDFRAIDRFRLEVEALGQLDHPNVVRATDAGITADGSPFLAMEFIEGVNLKEWSREHSFAAIPASDKAARAEHLRTVCLMIRDAALGLREIQRAGLIHRDIKPGNLMLLPDGRVKILDLGLAKLRQHLAEDFEPQTQMGSLIGTPEYMAPEQLRAASAVDIRADIYSLGCTFFHLLFGCPPSGNTTWQTRSELPTKLHDILDHMIATDPAARYQEPGQVVEALEKFVAFHQGRRRRVWGVLSFAALPPLALGAAFLVFYPVKPIPERNDEPIGRYVLPPVESSKNGETKKIANTPPLLLDEIRDAVNLRYRGNTEQASTLLRNLVDQLRELAGSGSPKETDHSLAFALSCLWDCEFFSGFASDTLSEKTVKRMEAGYREAAGLSVGTGDLETELSCKLRIICIRKKDGNRVERKNTAECRDGGKDIRTVLFDRLAGAMELFDDDDRPLRGFVEQFELHADPQWETRRVQELCLFALEFLIHRDGNNDKRKLDEDLKMLESVLLGSPWTPDFGAYFNCFFDLAIRKCDPDDHARLVRYLYRFRRQSGRNSPAVMSAGGTHVLFHFSPKEDVNGFAVYYPSDRQRVKRFEFAFNRNLVQEAIRKGESLALDPELVSLIRRDIDCGIPIALLWDDTMCWSLRRDALCNDDWPFDTSIAIEEILGQMK